MDKIIPSSESPMRSYDNQATLGMSSFTPKDQQQFGRNIRLAMSCIEGNDQPVNVKAMPDDETTLRQRLRTLTQEISSSQADLLELLVRFDDLEGWKSSGARHCAGWMNSEIGISMKLGWEYLRVGRKLRNLPSTRALFRAGKLSWSIIRLLVRVADAENEKILCHAALDGSVSDVARICNEYHWKHDDNGDGENDRAQRQWESRSLSWHETSIGSTRICLTLPPEVAQAFLNSVEHSREASLENEQDSKNVQQDSKITITQLRADAAVLMAENSLQSAGRDIATADRYQVIVSVEADELKKPTSNTPSNVPSGASSNSPSSSRTKTSSNVTVPTKRPTVKGVGAIARETARRVACDCSITTNTTKNGEPTNIHRKSRLWPPAMARAIKNRDQHCQFYGCNQTRNLQIHHIVHWADGGNTSVSNGVCLCQSCHTKVHEGGYRIQNVDMHEQRLNTQFDEQRHTNDLSMFDFEKTLRNDRESFDKVRMLSPTRYRFRIVNAAGQDIRHQSYTCTDTSNVTVNNDNNNNTSIQNDAPQSTRVASRQSSQPTLSDFLEPQKSTYAPSSNVPQSTHMASSDVPRSAHTPNSADSRQPAHNASSDMPQSTHVPSTDLPLSAHVTDSNSTRPPNIVASDVSRSTRIACAETPPPIYGSRKSATEMVASSRAIVASWMSAEQSGFYHVNCSGM